MFLVFVFLALFSLPHAVMADDAALPSVEVAPVSADTIESIGADTKERNELENFYFLRHHAAAWDLFDDAGIHKTLAFIDSVAAIAAYHGLNESHYALDQMRALVNSPDNADKIKLEVMITASLFRLGHDLHGDNLDLDSLYPGWNFHREAINLPADISNAVTNGRLDSVFDHIAPQNEAYRNLIKALKTYRDIAAKGAWPVIDAGGSLKPGDHDPRVAQLRARLTAEGYGNDTGASTLFDEGLSKTLTIYQMRNGLQPDGHLGDKTRMALNVSVADRIDQIRANMERWRHMNDDYPPATYAVVNIPDFTLVITEDAHEIYRGIVVDGQPERPTPFVHSRITNMVINPSWHVPVSLAKKDILPKLIKNPHYLEKMGIVIEGRDTDPAGTTINWKKINPDHFPYTLRQVPSDINSLGQLKFNFSNPFDVYMHGTPHQELFDKAERDFSSGCVRLEDPEGVAQILLEHTKDAKGEWDEKRIGDEIEGSDTQTVLLAKPMPIYFLYWTVFAGDDGQLNFRKDIYGYDSLLTQKM